MSGRTIASNWNWFRWVLVVTAAVMLLVYVPEYANKPFQFWAWAAILAGSLAAVLYKARVDRTH